MFVSVGCSQNSLFSVDLFSQSADHGEGRSRATRPCVVWWFLVSPLWKVHSCLRFSARVEEKSSMRTRDATMLHSWHHVTLGLQNFQPESQSSRDLQNSLVKPTEHYWAFYMVTSSPNPQDWPPREQSIRGQKSDTPESVYVIISCDCGWAYHSLLISPSSLVAWESDGVAPVPKISSARSLSSPTAEARWLQALSSWQLL